MYAPYSTRLRDTNEVAVITERPSSEPELQAALRQPLTFAGILSRSLDLILEHRVSDVPIPQRCCINDEGRGEVLRMPIEKRMRLEVERALRHREGLQLHAVHLHRSLE